MTSTAPWVFALALDLAATGTHGERVIAEVIVGADGRPEAVEAAVDYGRRLAPHVAPASRVREIIDLLREAVRRIVTLAPDEAAAITRAACPPAPA